jgi:hypothetical protein
MAMLESRLYRETLAAAEAFHARKLWLEFENDDCFAVVVPGEEQPMLASIMGQSGQEYGLVLFRGPNACSCLMSMLDRDPQDMGVAEETAFMGFSVGRYDETPPFGRSFLARARFTGRHSDTVPCFLVMDAGRHPRAPTRDEVESLLYALKGILKARDTGILEPEPLRPGKETLTLVIGGDPRDPEVSKEHRRYGVVALGIDSAAPCTAMELQDLPRLPSRWLIGFPTLPVTIQNDDRVVQSVLIVDETTELILTAHPVQGGTHEAVDVVIRAFQGENAQKTRGVPEEILIANRELFNALWPALDSAGVPCRYEPAIPLLDEVLRGLLNWCDDPDAEAERLREDPSAIPAVDDLDGWKACDMQLYRRAQARLAREGGASDRAIRRYFGDVELGDDFLDDPDDPFPGMCFFEWSWLDYRPTKKSKTLAEKMLAEDLPRAERLLLEARVEATPSVFKVQSIERGVSLDLLDVLFGSEVTLHDKALSESAVVDMSFPARVFPAGGFHFGSPLGPPLSALEVDDAIDRLEYWGMEPTREGARAKPHLFGRLWDWVEKRRSEQRPRRITNMDGEEICFHTATYAVADEAAARAAIAARKDIEWDDEDDAYIWERRKGDEPGALIGDSLTLGTLRFIGDELLLEVNSAGRLERARSWVDRVPGVTFHSVRSRTLEEVSRTATPPDDQIREEVPMTPELVAHIQETMRQHCMQWLDMPLPVFEGKTPREMCSTEEGKQRVARLIRTMPRPMGPGGSAIEVPRQEMLKALGLDEPDQIRPEAR